MSAKRTDFASGHLRLWQAKEDRLNFQKKWKAYAETLPCWTGLVRDEDDPLRYTVAAKLSSAPPAALSMLFSSWLHHLRACLDNSIYTLAVHSSGKNPPPAAAELYYPVSYNRAAFQKHDLSASKLTEQAVDIIERRQPYKQQGATRMSHLHWLNELARIDRHRFPHLAVGRISGVQRLKLHNGARFVVEQTFRPTEILATETPLQVIRTESALRQLDVAFAGRPPQVYPEILEWAKAGKASTAKGVSPYVDTYPRLLDRMERVELEVLAAFADLVRLAGLNPLPIIEALVRPDLDPLLLGSLGLTERPTSNRKKHPRLRGLPGASKQSGGATRPLGRQGRRSAA